MIFIAVDSAVDVTIHIVLTPIINEHENIHSDDQKSSFSQSNIQ